MSCFTTVLADEEYVFIDELKSLDNTFSAKNVSIVCSPTEKYGDTSRLVKSGKAEGEIVYNVSNLRKIEIMAYETVELKDQLTVYFSEDGQEWDTIHRDRTLMQSDKWDKKRYKIKDTYTTKSGKYIYDMSFVKIVLPATSAQKDGAISPEELQLGEIKFFFNSGGGFVNKPNPINANGLSAVFYDKMNTLSGKWTVLEEHTDYVKVKDFDGEKYLTLTTKSGSSTDTYITADDLNLENGIYRINFKMAADNNAFDRNVIIATNNNRANGKYIYPISFSTTGKIGYRDQSFTYCNFPVAYDYIANTVYQISIILDTVNANEIVYINGTLVTPSPVSLAESADGGISQIKLANMETPSVDGNTYFSSFICEEKINMLGTVYGSYEFADMSSNFAKEFATNLVYQNILDYSTNFNPTARITTNDFLSWVIRAYKGVAPTANPIEKAVELGIVENGEFTNGSATVTREKMASVLSSIAIGNDENKQFYNNVFADSNSISANYKDGVNKAAALGIISAVKGDSFRPGDYATKAEAATMVWKTFYPAARSISGYTIGIYAGDGFTTQAQTVYNSLKGTYDTKIINESDLSNRYIMSTDILSCIIFMNGIDTTSNGISFLHSYLENGGDMVVLGEDLFHTLNTPTVKIPIFEGYDQEQLNYTGAKKIVTAEGQDYFGKIANINGNYSGTSAVGYVFADNSKYIPVLEVRDKYDRRLGYASGVLIEYEGQYRGGNWLFYGIRESAFYNGEPFISTLKSALNNFKSSTFLAQFSRDAEINKNIAALENYEITEPRPSGYVHVSDDGKSLIDADGNELFVVGQNIYGLSEYCYSSGDQTKGTFSVEKMEQQFKLSSDAGVNVYRFWWPPYLEDIEANKAAKVLINLARKYRIYLIFVGPGSNKTENDLAWYERFTSTYGDEPMVIGYDLMNEPNMRQVLLSFGGNGNDNPLLNYDIFNFPEFNSVSSTYQYLLDNSYKDFEGIVSEDLRRRAAAAEALFRKKVIDYPTSGYSLENDFAMTQVSFQKGVSSDIINMLSAVVKKGIKERKDIIHQNAPHALVTVGYMNFVAMLPGVAESLDFWNHHTYVKPDTYDNVIEQLSIYNKQKTWSDGIPSIMGEFGLTDGHYLYDKLKQTKSAPSPERVRTDTAGGYQFLMWLYAWANNYGGAIDWMGTPRNPTAYRYYATSNWTPETKLYLERHSIYYYDGNPENQMALQPQGIALKFFKKFRKTHKIGDGDLTIFEDTTQLKAGYNFEADTAEYICASRFESDRLEYTTDDNSSPLLLLDWACDKLFIESTKDMQISIKLKSYLPKLNSSSAYIEGKYKASVQDGDYITLDLLANERICIKDYDDTIVCISQ